MSLSNLCSTCMMIDYCPIRTAYNNIDYNDESLVELFHTEFIDADFQVCKIQEAIKETALEKPAVKYKTRVKTLLVSGAQNRVLAIMACMHDCYELMEYCKRIESEEPSLFPGYSALGDYYKKEKIRNIARIKQENKNLEYKTERKTT